MSKQKPSHTPEILSSCVGESGIGSFPDQLHTYSFFDFHAFIDRVFTAHTRRLRKGTVVSCVCQSVYRGFYPMIMGESHSKEGPATTDQAPAPMALPLSAPTTCRNAPWNWDGYMCGWLSTERLSCWGCILRYAKHCRFASIYVLICDKSVWHIWHWSPVSKLCLTILMMN